MPKKNGIKFPYTKKGRKAAGAYARKILLKKPKVKKSKKR